MNLSPRYSVLETPNRFLVKIYIKTYICHRDKYSIDRLHSSIYLDKKKQQ